MSSILRIEEGMKVYTQAEKRIASYILSNKELVSNESAHIVAKKTDTSAATVVRFAKRLGYKGFTDLKIQVAKDSRHEPVKRFDQMIQESDTLATIVNKAEQANQETFLKTYRLLDIHILEKMIETLNNARNVYIVGVGGTALVCQDLHYKLTRIGVQTVYEAEFHMLLTSVANIKKEDAIIIFSYSGETYEVLLAQKTAHENGAQVLVVTSNPRSSIVKNADHTLLIPQEEQELRLGAIASRFSFLAVSDLIYLGIAHKNLSSIKNKLVNTRALLKNLSNR